MWKKKSIVVVAVGVAVAVGAFFVIRARGSDPDRILARADEYFAAGAIDEARIEYMNVFKADPGNARAIRQLGFVWTEMGAPIQAGSFLTAAQKLAPEDSEVGRELAKALLAIGQIDAAREQSLKVLETVPTDGESLLILANTSRSEEDLEVIAARLKAFDPATKSDFHLADAILAGRRGDVEAVPVALEKALALEPESAQVHLALATYREVTSDRDGALAALEKASALSEVRSPSRLRYARALAREGEAEKAEGLVREITETSRFFLPAWALLAEWTLQKGDTKAASAMVNEILGRDAANPDGNMLRALALQSEGRPRKPFGFWRIWGGFFPDNAGIEMVIAQAHLKNGDAAKAGAALDRVLQLAPEHIEASLLQAQLNLRTGAAIATALSMEALLKRSPGMEAAELLLARAYEAEGRLRDASGVFRGQIERDAGKAGSHFMLGMMLRREELEDEALASFEKAQELAPKDMAITFQLIEMDLARGDFASAHRRAGEQETLNPEDWAPHYFHGKVFAAEKKWAESEKALLKALEIRPDSLTVYDLLLGSYVQQGRVPEAIAGIETYLERNPKGISQRLILGMLCEREGQVDKAVAAYERILEENPDFVPALNNLAFLYLAPPGGDFARAVGLAGRARALAPSDPAIADTLGWAYYKTKDYAKALPLVEEAAAGLPTNSEIQYHLGMVLYMRGREDAARIALQEALSDEATFAGRAEAEEYLARLGKGDGTTGGVATLEELQKRLEANPGDVVARVALARLQEAGGEFAAAADSYARALEANSGLLEAQTGLARLYAGPLDDLPKAGEYAREARAQHGRDPAVARVLGEIVLREKDFQYAYNLLLEAARGKDVDSRLRLSLAHAAYGIGRLEEARKTAQEIVDTDAADTSEAKEAGRFLAMTGALPDRAAVEADVREHPDFLPALMAQAALERAAGTPDKAVVLYEGILKANGDFVPAQAGLASVLAVSGTRLDEAQRLAEKVRVALPEDPGLGRTLGIIRYGEGDEEAAIRLLKASDAKLPLDAEGLYFLGLAHLKAESKVEAIAALERALGIDGLAPDFRNRVETSLDEAKALPDEE